MTITSLAYLGIRSEHIDDWSVFARSVLGMQLLDGTSKSSAFRMDDHQQRLIVSDEHGDQLAFIGWEVSDSASLDEFAAVLERNQVTVTIGDADLCSRRFVERLIAFNDPEGNRIELVCKPHLATDPFVAGRAISGFITGAFGMGHAVLHVGNAKALLPFYTGVLGFKLSDFGLTPYPMYFLHVNGRHHSFALIGSGQSGFHHFMVEYETIDDVGQGYDIAQGNADQIAYTLGRHTNDYMTSFYATSPSGFFVESGWGGRIIEPDSWQPHETFDGPSFWGHDRLYLPDDKRAQMRQMRLDAASKGIQAPPIVDCPWLYNARR